jgi:stearoyl-CoA desaturase (delta-9 desaturase)
MYTFRNKFWERVAFLVVYFALGPISYLSARAYAILHRLHHAFSDTDRDPHRPYPGFFGVFKTLWVTARRYNSVFKRHEYMDIDGHKIKIAKEFTENVPLDWPLFDRLVHNWPIRIFFLMWYIIAYYHIIEFFDLPNFMYVMVLLHAGMSPIHGAIVNYYAHKYGDQEHETGDTSRNIPRTARAILWMAGELYHNNHHKFPGRADFSLGKGDDGSYKLMLLLERLGIIKLNKSPV